MELTGRQSKQLSEALIDAFPKGKDLEMMLLYELEKKLNEISLGDTYKQVVFDVIKYFEAQGKIEDLIKAALRDNPSNPKLLSFNSCYSHAITENDWNNLKLILEKIDFDIVKLVYQETLPVASLTDNPELNNPPNIDSIISILSNKYPQTSTNIPSVLEFSKKIANKLQGDTIEYKNLEAWFQQLAARLKIAIYISPEPKNKVKSASGNTYLFVVVYPQHKNKFRLECEYILDEVQNTKPQPLDLQELLKTTDENDENYKNVKGRGIICDSFDLISQQLEEIIDKFLEEFRGKISKPIIEIFLPYKYLGQNIDDKWRIKEENQDNCENLITIVEQFDMMLHPIERFTGNRAYINFETAWKRLKLATDENTGVDDIIHSIDKVSTINSNNYKEVRYNLKNKIGFKLESYLSESSQEQDIFWTTILGAGVPIAFWTRHKTPEHVNLEEIDCHLTSECLQNNLQKLIENICDIRRKAYIKANPSEYLGYHLGVLCDNPNRIPKIERLQEFKMG